MTPSSDDVHHLMDESSARLHPKRGRKSRGLRQPERRIKAKRLQYNAIQPSSCGDMDQRISSSCAFIRNESSPNNRRYLLTLPMQSPSSHVETFELFGRRLENQEAPYQVETTFVFASTRVGPASRLHSF
ncbi:unnamed protein product [Protopolystoma xenopodis]|uniref:Uncharacterized protein n=1 Tax=Protopolystoma xenopodis TaxID=117903 RepID=A0A3S5ABW1_9PLAT|nr:unnamed protein product [Protopolystoma xenopodis]